MNMSFTNSELRFAPPEELRFSTSVRAGHQAAAEARVVVGQALARRLGDAIAGMVAFLGRGAVTAELRRMSDRELSDIGLGRSDLGRVFNADFAREHASRGF